MLYNAYCLLYVTTVDVVAELRFYFVQKSMGRETCYTVSVKTNVAGGWRVQMFHTKKLLITTGCIVVTYPAEADIDVKRFTLFPVQTTIIIPLLPSICIHICPVSAFGGFFWTAAWWINTHLVYGHHAALVLHNLLLPGGINNHYSVVLNNKRKSIKD